MTATLEDLDRRVTALEKAQTETAETQRWMASTLGRIAFVQDEHTATLAQHTRDIDEVKAGLRRVEKKVDDLTSSLPSIVADAMREVLKER